MKVDKLLYFTPAEYIVMMELAGGGAYSMLCDIGLEPDDSSLVQAVALLFQRGLIHRQGDGFALSGSGRPFFDMRQARIAVLLSSVPAGRAAVCYLGKDALWLLESVDDLLTRRYRLRQVERGAIRSWLEDAELLDPPVLCDADAAELGLLLADMLNEPSGELVFRLERHINGGPLLCAYELLEGRSGRIVVRQDDQSRTAGLYTEEALSQMLIECFGEENI